MVLFSGSPGTRTQAEPLSVEGGGCESDLSHVPTLPGLSCVTSDELLNLSLPWSPPELWKGWVSESLVLDSGQVSSMMYAPKSASSMFQNLSFPFTLALPWALRTHACSVPFYGVSLYALQTRQLKQQSFMLSEFWGPKVQNHGVSRAVVSLRSPGELEGAPWPFPASRGAQPSSVYRRITPTSTLPVCLLCLLLSFLMTPVVRLETSSSVTSC